MLALRLWQEEGHCKRSYAREGGVDEENEDSAQTTTQVQGVQED